MIAIALMAIATLGLAGMMRRWAIAAATQGSRSPATTWSTSYFGTELCMIAALTAGSATLFVGDAIEPSSYRLVLTLWIALMTAHAGWSVERVIRGLITICGRGIEPDDMEELQAAILTKEENLLKTIGGSHDTYVQALRHHRTNSRRAYLWGLTCGVTTAAATCDPAAWSLSPAWSIAATAAASLAIGGASANWYQTGDDDERFQRTDHQWEQGGKVRRVGRKPNVTPE